VFGLIPRIFWISWSTLMLGGSFVSTIRLFAGGCRKP
jgi:hypothetical protein